MKFLVDMNLSPRLVALLNANNYDAIHWVTIGQQNAPDSIIFEWAKTNQYTIITLDVDFGTLLAHSRSAVPSVIQIRRENVDPVQLQLSLAEIFSLYADKIEAGALIVLDEKKVRIRMLPL